MSSVDERIAKVYHWSNGMTMVFDHDGKQMPEYQGPTEKVLPILRENGWIGPKQVRNWFGPEAINVLGY